MNKEKELLLIVIERKAQYFDHIIRGQRYEILKLIVEGKLGGKRSVGRRQNLWLKDLRRWFACSLIDIFRAAVSKVMLII